MKKVKILTEIVGCYFARVGVVFDAKTLERIYTTNPVPLNNVGAARMHAENYAAKQHWIIIN